jgi:flagellar biosynthetic protein FliR
VIDAAPQTVIAVFLIFCRIGGALMIMPGFSSSYVPPRVRLSIAFVVTLALAPMFLPAVEQRLGTGEMATVLGLIVSETATGFVIGFVGRVFFSALAFIGAAATQAIGLSAMPGTIVEDSEQPPPIAALLTITATTMIFAMNLHWEVLRGLVDSYQSIPPGEGIGTRIALIDVTDQLTEAFLLALRIGSPFLIYSLIFNFALGITNKLTPQIPVFFIAMPFGVAGGMILLFFVIKDMLLAFMSGFGAWLGGG